MAQHNQWIPEMEWTSLPRNEIDVWRFSLSSQKEDRKVLSPDELERLNRTDSTVIREKRIAGRAHLRRILSKYTQTDPSRILFDYGENQKPTLPEYPDLSFNLSHSDNMGLIAVTYARRVGIDLEHIETERPFLRIAERFLTKIESDFIDRHPEQERFLAFYRIWTLNEAYLKALGTGLSVSSNDFSIVPNQERGRFLHNTNVPSDIPQNWMFETIGVENSYLGALCYEGLDTITRFWSV